MFIDLLNYRIRDVKRDLSFLSRYQDLPKFIFGSPEICTEKKVIFDYMV